MLSGQSGLNVGLVLQSACAETNLDPEVRDRTIDVLVRHIEEALQFQREYSAKNKRCERPRRVASAAAPQSACSIFMFALVNVGRFYGSYVAARRRKLCFLACKRRKFSVYSSKKLNVLRKL